MNKVVFWVGGATLVASIVNGGCKSEDEACPGVVGQFEAVHQLIEGSCSAVSPIRYNLQDKTLFTDEVSDTGGMLRTKVDRMGCTLKITRTRLDTANRELWQMTGNLDIDDSETLSGTMTRYEWGEDGQIVCEGKYRVTMTLVGPATQ